MLKLGLVFLLSLLITIQVNANCGQELARLVHEYPVSQSKSLPSSLGKLPNTRQQFTALFSAAEEKYLRKVDFKELYKVVKDISKNGFKDIKKKKLKQLVEDRILAQRLRGSYTLFSQGNKPPREFHKFVRDFGYLNDAIRNGDKKWARDVAKKILKRMEEGDHNPRKFGFAPADPNALVEYSLKTFAWIEAQLVKKIDIHAYHDVRKKIRDFKFMYATLNKHSPNPEYARLAEKASKISDEMGAQKEFMFDVQKLGDDALVEVEDKFKKDIREFIEEFKAINGVDQ